MDMGLLCVNWKKTTQSFDLTVHPMKRQEATKIQATLGEDHGGCEGFGCPGSYRQEPIHQHHGWRNHWQPHHCSLDHDERISSRNRRPSGGRGGNFAQLAHRTFGRFGGLSESSWRSTGLHIRVGSRHLPSIGDRIVCGREACLRSSHQQHTTAKLHEELDFDLYESGFHLLFHRKFQWAQDTKLNLHWESLL